MSGNEPKGPKHLQELMKSREHIGLWRGFSVDASRLEADYALWLRQRYQRARIALFLMAALLLATAPLYGRLLLNGSGADLERGILQMRLFEWLLAIPACVIAIVQLRRSPDSTMATRMSLLASFAVFITLMVIRRVSAEVGGNIPVELVMVVPLIMASVGGVRNIQMLPLIMLCTTLSLSSEIAMNRGPELARALLGVAVMSTLSFIAAIVVDRLTRKAWLDRAITELSAMLDGVTGLPNRTWFNRDAAALMRQLQRLTPPMAVALIDLDFFKKLNDTHGHAAGDVALAAVGELLLREFARRPQDLVARYGGEEFVLVLYDATDAHARQIGDRVVSGIHALRVPNTSTAEGRLTASIGIWQGVPKRSATMEDLLKAADDALYKAKDSGRNRYLVVNG